MKKLLSVCEAQDILITAAQQFSLSVNLNAAPDANIEKISLLKSRGRLLANDVHAERNQPPEDLSAMDGYGVRTQDLQNNIEAFTVIGQAPAGAPFMGEVKEGECVRIFTGAVMPRGADRVVIQEEAEPIKDNSNGNRVMFKANAQDNNCVRQAGIDFSTDQLLAHKGEYITAEKCALLAAANKIEVQVYKRPKIAVVAIGDELVEPGEKLDADKIINSAAYGVCANLQEWGADVHYLGILPDDMKQAAEQLKQQKVDGFDLIVPIGGASVGDRDITKPTLRSLGADIIFEGVAVKPGKPVWFAKFANHSLILGLPGNPASALVCLHLFGRLIVDSLAGRNQTYDSRLKTAILENDILGNGPRESYLRAKVTLNEEGVLTAKTAHQQDSSLLTPFAASHGLVQRLPNDTKVQKGEKVRVLLLRPVL